MRTSKDIWRLTDGTFVALSQMEEPPEGATVWEGYDYARQFWVYKGQRDTRTLAELKAALN